MSSVCAEQHQHKCPSAHQLYLAGKKSLRDLDIPPRKLLNRRLSASFSPETAMDRPEETLFQKFLAYNSAVDSDGEDSDPYSADHFRMYEFKVRKCTRSRSHDWTDCPFAHPGEKARRRCPRRYNYSGNVCADFRRGSCSRGDSCEFAHGVFECWLHPSRYRTEACKDGKNCQRKICFFAHTPSQLRLLPAPEASGSPKKYPNSGHCCSFCRCHSGINQTASPTSTLNVDIDNLSPPTSPPFSPAQSGGGFSPISRFANRLTSPESTQLTHFSNGGLSYKDYMNELMSSMEAMNVNEMEGSGRVMTPAHNVYEDKFINDSSINGPDLGWVNDLLT